MKLTKIITSITNADSMAGEHDEHCCLRGLLCTCLWFGWSVCTCNAHSKGQSSGSHSQCPQQHSVVGLLFLYLRDGGREDRGAEGRKAEGQKEGRRRNGENVRKEPSLKPSI